MQTCRRELDHGLDYGANNTACLRGEKNGMDCFEREVVGEFQRHVL